MSSCSTRPGTITFGNRLASRIVPMPGRRRGRTSSTAALQSSLDDETPEGRSIVELARGATGRARCLARRLTRRSLLGDDRRDDPVHAPRRGRAGSLADGSTILKGAVDAIRSRPRRTPRRPNSATVSDEIAGLGATPLAISHRGRALGVIELKDTVKPGLAERFAELRRMGIRTIMITGDNPLTAKTIAARGRRRRLRRRGQARGQDRDHPARAGRGPPRRDDR